MFTYKKSIMDNGVRKTLDMISDEILGKMTSVQSGEKVFDWMIPDGWNVKIVKLDKNDAAFVESYHEMINE